MLRAGGSIIQGWSQTQQGKLAEGIDSMCDGLNAWQATNALSHYPLHLALYAEALGRSGQLDKALATIDHAISLVTVNGEGFYEAELYRICGGLHRLGMSDASDASAERYYERARSIAQSQSSLSLQLRTAVDLARLGDHQRSSLDRRAELKNTLSRFSEGFD